MNMPLHEVTLWWHSQYLLGFLLQAEVRVDRAWIILDGIILNHNAVATLV
jgi:hypothetical protein